MFYQVAIVGKLLSKNIIMALSLVTNKEMRSRSSKSRSKLKLHELINPRC